MRRRAARPCGGRRERAGEHDGVARQLLGELQTAASGLTGAEASLRLSRSGANEPRGPGRLSAWRELIAPLRNPLTLLLLFAASVSAAVGDPVGAASSSRSSP